MKNLEIGILNELYGSRLTPRQRGIIRNYYDDDLSLSEIADNCEITRQAVADALKKGEHTLQSLESEMGFYKKLTGIKADAEKIVDLLSTGDQEAAKAVAGKLLDRI